MNTENIPKVKTSTKLLNNDKCRINGDDYPLVIGQIVRLLKKGDQPRITVLADPGHGKTFALGRLGEILHEELDILKGDFNPEQQITMNPEKHINFIRTNQQRIIIVPDADAVYPADEHYTAKNKGNKKAIYLSRITGNPLAYDSHELGKTAKAIRTNHNVRLVSVGGADTYAFKASFIKRENDSLTTNMIKEGKGIWKVDKPKPETVERIEELDESGKMDQLEDAEEKIREEETEEIDNMF